MHLEPAPYYAEPTDEPAAKAYWVKTADNLRLRVAHWGVDDGRAAKGTVLLFTGRTEYVEKYAITAQELALEGYATFSLDWRGQGLADRIADNPMAGHVELFEDYQTDVACLLEAAEALNLPKPYFLLAHSMGGCIGLRALMHGLPVAAAGFTGPMWGIGISPFLHPVAKVVTSLASLTGQMHRLTPGTKNDTYVLDCAFEQNQLTKDRPMYERLQHQARANPSLTLGGPSLRWLQRALEECKALARLPSPKVPCVTILGTDEKIVSIPAIQARMDKWPNGRLITMDAGEHEILMEGADKRGTAMRAIVELFDAQL